MSLTPTHPVHPVPIRPPFPVHPIRPPVPPTGITYSIWVPQFVIHTTRARSSDTDFATLGVVVNAADGTQVNQYGPATLPLGDLGDGTHTLNMHVDGMGVPEGGSIAVSFTILNHGSSKAANEIVSALNQFGTAILKALGGGKMSGKGGGTGGSSAPVDISSWESFLISVGGPLVIDAIKAILADCDGLVVTESLTITASDLETNAGQAPWTWSTEYHGTDTETGCGHNSDYTVSYAVMASPPCVTVPNLVGLTPPKALQALEHAGLAGKEVGIAKAPVDEPEIASQNPPAGMPVLPSTTTVDYSVHVPEGHGHPLP